MKLSDYLARFSLVIMTLTASLPVYSQQYDLVILNGRVMDPETNFDAIRNIGIKAGKISAITETQITGDVSVDATGHVVAPGFIDLHSHGQDPFSIKVSLRDGVTTPLELEVGAYPVDEYYDMREGSSQANYGVSVSHVAARLVTLDKIDNPGGLPLYSGAVNRTKEHGSLWSTSQTAAGTKQRSEILDRVEEGLKQGGLGIGFPVGYYTSVSSSEVLEVAGLAKKYKTFILSHVRYMSLLPPSGLMGVEEMIAVAQENQVPIIINHVPSNCLGLTEDCFTLLNTLRENGMKIGTEFYPYTAGSSIIGADYLAPGFQERMGMDYSDIVMVATGEVLDEALYKKYRAENPGAGMIMHHIKQEDMFKAFKDPSSFVGADGMPFVTSEGGIPGWDAPYEEGRGHPRGAGTHAQLLRLTRETKAISLMSAIAKLSYFQAKWLEDMVPDMKIRGRLQVGSVADITIFDPETVAENSTYDAEKNALPSTGIPYVIVNGTVVVKDSKVLKRVYPGQAIRNKVLP